jgi:hypothetical protein
MLEKTERTIKNGQSTDTGNIGLKTKKTNGTIQKTKKMSNTKTKTKKRGEPRCSQTVRRYYSPACVNILCRKMQNIVGIKFRHILTVEI